MIARIAAYILLLLVCEASAVAFAEDGGTRRALLIGINEYQDKDINDLRGPVNDVALMKHVLGLYGFQSRNITTILNEAATREGILAAIETLIAKSSKDDVVVIHFSGHGSYIQDGFNGNELDEADRLDETLVTHNSTIGGDNDITDDELVVLIRRLATRAGSVTVILDSCHSGTASRDAYTTPRIVDRQQAREAAGALSQGNRSVGASHEAFLPDGANFVLWSAARSYELALEKSFTWRRKSYGVFTYLLAETLKETLAQRLTNTEAIERVRGKIGAYTLRQTPALEGTDEGANRIVFGTEHEVVEPYYVATRNGRNQVEIEGGEVQGFTAGSIYDIYPGTVRVFSDASSRLAQVRIRNVFAFHAVADLIEGSLPGDDIPYRAVLRQHQFDTLTVPLFIEGSGASPTLQRIAAAIDKDPVLVASSSPNQEAELILKEEGGAIRIEGARGMPLLSTVSLEDADPVERVMGQLEQWARWINVRALKPEISVLQVSAAIEVGGKQARNVEIQDGDPFQVVIENNGEWDVFVNIVDLASDGSIDVFWPLYNQAQRVKAFSTHKTLAFPIQVLRGERDLDVIKVIVTSHPVDLKRLQQGAIRSGSLANPTPLEQLLEGTMLDATRSVLAPVGTWATEELVIRSVKP